MTNGGRPCIEVGMKELAGVLSAVATQGGFVSVAEWLVETGKWSDEVATPSRCVIGEEGRRVRR